jgi:hypothetical protein
LPPLPNAIKDISHNDHYKPVEDIVDNWTVYVEKDEKDTFVLRFGYQMKTADEDTDSWVRVKSLSVECAVAQGDYVVIDLEKKDDRVTIILQEHRHPFNKAECENGNPDAGCFNMATEFQDYACNAPWTGKWLGRLLNNVTRVNGAVLESRKGKQKKKVVSERPARVPKPVPESARPSQSGASRGSRPSSKRSHSQMESSGLTEGPDVSSTLTVSSLLKKEERPDSDLSTKIFQKFDERTKTC